MSAEPHPKQKERCARCDEREARLAAALEDRDAALAQLAAERERLNALRLAFRASAAGGDSDQPVADEPLRYRLADAANTLLKRSLGPVHRGAKKAIGKKLKRKREDK